MQIVSFGGGTNSTAMVIGMRERCEAVDAIVFADTGGEKPETYAHVKDCSEWLVSRGMPAIIIVRESSMVGSVPVKTLEAECLEGKRLPGVAYGFGSCSDKWKQRPFKRWFKQQGVDNAVVCIGFDADESHRSRRGDEYDSGYMKRYPLIEWGWGRDECVEAIARAGLAQPGKSSCFFCPNSRKHEIFWLRDKHPELLDRAIAMEKNAELTSIKGLGRNFAWGNLVKQGEMDFEAIGEMPCGCYDG